jgi:hypothetical protein
MYIQGDQSLFVSDDYSTKNNTHTIDGLKMAITEYIRNVDCAILNMVFENIVWHVNTCLETGGGTLWTLLVTFCIVIIRCTETFQSPCRMISLQGVYKQINKHLQVVLIVNVATYWALTHHYLGMNALQSNYQDLVVLGFPCNQFGMVSYSTVIICKVQSNENLKSAIKIRNTARLSCKLSGMILMVWRMADRWQYDAGMQRYSAVVG